MKAAWGSRKGVAGRNVTFMGCAHKLCLSRQVSRQVPWAHPSRHTEDVSLGGRKVLKVEGAWYAVRWSPCHEDRKVDVAPGQETCTWTIMWVALAKSLWYPAAGVYTVSRTHSVTGAS